MEPTTKGNPCALVAIERELLDFEFRFERVFGPGSIATICPVRRGDAGCHFYASSKEPFAPEAGDRMLAVSASVPVALVHMCDVAIDDDHLALRYPIIQNLSVLELCSTSYVDRGIFSQRFREERLEKRSVGDLLGI